MSHRFLSSANEWPPEVELILSALDAGASLYSERRQTTRMPYRTRARMSLFSDAPDAEPWLLFTRDIDHRGLGFITNRRLPLGYGGTIALRTPRGQRLKIGCTILRCRIATGSWFEGAVSFNREQSHLFPT